jgi:hypothetical protein
MKQFSNSIPLLSASGTPNLLKPVIANEEVSIAPDDINPHSSHLDNIQLQRLPSRIRSITEHVHLNINTAYRRYIEEETRDFETVEQYSSSPPQDIDSQNILSFLDPIIDLNDKSLLRYRELNDSLDKESKQLEEEIDSKVKELDTDLDEEHSRLRKDSERRDIAFDAKLEEIDQSIERRLHTICSKITDINNQRDELSTQLICKDTCPSTAEVKIIESKIKELDILVDAEWKRHSETVESRSLERDKAYESERQEVENEENKSHKLSEELRNERTAIKSFKNYWYEYLKSHREKINNWFESRINQFSNFFIKISDKARSSFANIKPPWAIDTGTTLNSFVTQSSDIAAKIATQAYGYGKQGADLAIANASIAAIPTSMSASAVGMAAEQVGLTSVSDYFNNQVGNVLQSVTDNWSAANEGPLGRAFDTQIHGVTSLLEPLIGHNQQFLADWITGNHSARIVYTPDSIQVRDMAASPNVQRAISEFYAKGAPKEGTKFNYGTFQAFWETIVDPRTANWKSTAMQVGGYDGATVTNNGDATMTIRIKNTAGANSFFYHLLPNQTREIGPMHSVKQIFEWTIPIDPSRLPKINQL